MADGTPYTPNAAIIVQDDEVTTVNGGAVAASKVQRMKMDSVGADGAHRDVSKDFPLPVYKPNRSATGSLTALNSAVSLVLDGDGDVSMDIAVTALVGTIVFEQRLPGGTWFQTNATVSATSGPTPIYVNPASGLYRLTSGGAGEVRVRVSAFTSGSAVVIIGSSASSNGIYANQILPARLFDGTNAAAIKGASTAAAAADPAIVVALSPNSAVTAPALTKATQGANGFSTQDLKDAGRVIFSAATVIAGVTAVTVEALLSMVATRDGVAVAGATTFAVTAGKRLRITGISVGMISTGASVLSMRFALRMNPAGAAVAASPILRIIPVPSGAALAQAGGYADIEFTDGIELSGTHQFGITQIGNAATGTCWVSVSGFEY